MILLTTLYDEYIDRSILTEQKNPFEYIVPPPPQEGSKQLFLYPEIFHFIPTPNIFVIQNLFSLIFGIRDQNVIYRSDRKCHYWYD